MVSNQYWIATSLSSLKWQITTQAIFEPNHKRTSLNNTIQFLKIPAICICTGYGHSQVLSEKVDRKHLVKMSVPTPLMDLQHLFLLKP